MAKTFDVDLTLQITSKDDANFKTTLSLKYENMSEAKMMQTQAMIVEPLAKSLIAAGFEKLNAKQSVPEQAPGVIR